MKNKTYKIIIIIIGILIAYLVLDYVNIPSYMGINPKHMNVDLFSTIFNVAIVVILYVISFYYIDNRQNEKDDNARDIVKVLISKSFQECFDNLEFLDNRSMIEEYIIPKIDGNKTDSENRVVNNLQTLPFGSFESVIGFASNGYVEKGLFEDYLDIKKEYQSLVSLKITFFDLVNPKTSEQRAMYYNIHFRDSTLKDKLKKYLD